MRVLSNKIHWESDVDRSDALQVPDLFLGKSYFHWHISSGFLVLNSQVTFRLFAYIPFNAPAYVGVIFRSRKLFANPSFEFLITILPPNLLDNISIDRLEFVFLKCIAFVPDDQRGVDIPDATVRILPANALEKSKRIHASWLLILPPTPDFSMPYNVIVMTSTDGCSVHVCEHVNTTSQEIRMDQDSVICTRYSSIW